MAACPAQSYPRVAATVRPRSPPVPRSSRQPLAPLCSPCCSPLPLLCLLPTTPATTVAIVREHWSSAIMPCHHPQEKPPAYVTMRPTAPAASSSVWSSPWTAASGPPLVKQPTPRAPPGYHAPPWLVNRLPQPPYRPVIDVLPHSDCRCRGECYSSEPLLPDASQTGSPTVVLPIAVGRPPSRRRWPGFGPHSHPAQWGSAPLFLSWATSPPGLVLAKWGPVWTVSRVNFL
jgi:hypothetical protein